MASVFKARRGLLPFWDPNYDPNRPAEEQGYSLWLFSPNLWEQMTIGGHQIPGRVDSSAAKTTVTLNKLRSSGKHGARITFTGKDPADFDVKIYLCNPPQWERWQGIEPKLYGGDRSAPVALDAWSPSLVSVRIKGVAIYDIQSPAPTEVPGERVITIKMVEYSGPAEAKARKSATKTLKPPEVRPEFKEPNVSRRDGSTAYVPPSNAAQTKPSQSPRTAGP